MKKILLFIVALVATLSMNAQTTEIHNASGKVAAYLGADVNVKFGVAGDGQPTIEVYKGDVWQKTYTGSEYKVVSTPVEETFKAVYDTNGGVNTLTFYYDAVDHSENGITVYQDGTDKYLFDNAQSEGAKWGYNDVRESVSKVVIDESVKKYSSLTSTAYMFMYMLNATGISGAEYLNVANVTDMSEMFSSYGYNTKDFNTVPNVSGWNTGNVKNMANMFYRYGYRSDSLTVVPDVSGWKTGNVTNMYRLFRSYGGLSTSLAVVPNVSKWNTGNVKNMANMFDRYGYMSASLNTVPDVSNWNTGNVTDMSGMFNTYGYASKNISCVLDLSGWDLSKIEEDKGANVFNFKPKTFNVTIPGKTGDKVNEESNWYYGDGNNSITPPSDKSFTMFGRGIGVVSPTAGVTDNKVKWLQLWEDGPKFAVCNVGVTDGKAESYGDYFTWANNIAGSQWGSSWRMPTKKDFQALLDNCTREPIENYNDTGVNGVKFTGTGDFSGNSIFLPAAGIDINGVVGKGQYEYYWSSTPDGSNDGKAYAIGYNNYSMGFSVNVSDRTYGFSVRAVYQEPTTGTAKRKGDIDVNWVQLWKGGPKFAEYNVGATNNKAEDYGGYYCWGKTTDKDSQSAYNEGESALTGDDDTATNLWGSNWRMPTKDELDALTYNCTCTWTEDYNGTGVNGWLCKGEENTDYASNSVFLPAASDYSYGRVEGPGGWGAYWSSTPKGSDKAWSLYFDSDLEVVSSGNRFPGYSVRAVLAK